LRRECALPFSLTCSAYPFSKYWSHKVRGCVWLHARAMSQPYLPQDKESLFPRLDGAHDAGAKRGCLCTRSDNVEGRAWMMSRAKREHFAATQKEHAQTPCTLPPKWVTIIHGHDLPAALTHVLTLTSSPEWMMPSSPMTPAVHVPHNCPHSLGPLD
jgi:hypothetical protein